MCLKKIQKFREHFNYKTGDSLTADKQIKLAFQNALGNPEEFPEYDELFALGLEVEFLDLSGIEFKNQAHLEDTLYDAAGIFPNIKHLYLHDCNLTEIPHEVNLFNHLEDLDVSHNEISKIPPHLINSTNLTNLVAGYNCIDNVPYSLADMPKLKALDLVNNKISEKHVTDVLIRVKGLEKLSLIDNPLSEDAINSLNQEIEQGVGITYLPTLGYEHPNKIFFQYLGDFLDGYTTRINPKNTPKDKEPSKSESSKNKQSKKPTSKIKGRKL